MDFIVPIVAMAVAVFLFVALRRSFHTYLSLEVSGLSPVRKPTNLRPHALRQGRPPWNQQLETSSCG